MKNKILIALMVAILVFSTMNIVLAQPTKPTAPTRGGGTPPDQPSGLTAGSGTPPARPTPPTEGNDTAPLKQRLEVFYDDKESYINQKRQCKEEVVVTNAPSGTCWDRLKPVMVGLLQKEIMLTGKRLTQLDANNITIPNRAKIDSVLASAKATLSDPTASKIAIKSAAKSLEEAINDIEDAATENQPQVLIKQMDNLMIKSDALTAKLESKLAILKAQKYDTGELERMLTDYKSDLAKAKEEIASAKAKYADSNNSSDIAKVAKEIRTFINNSKQYLEKAFDKARKMVPEMSGSEGGQQPNGSGGKQPGGSNGPQQGDSGNDQPPQGVNA